MTLFNVYFSAFWIDWHFPAILMILYLGNRFLCRAHRIMVIVAYLKSIAQVLNLLFHGVILIQQLSQTRINHIITT